MASCDIPLLRTEHLTRAAGDRLLVDDVSFAVRRGDVVGIVRPSGAGKSSFLRLLNRLDEPTGGTVYLEGRDYRSVAPREVRRRIGMVMQTAALFAFAARRRRIHVEAALALGAAPDVSVAPYVESSFHASLIPAIDSLRSLGIVWIPGLMTGMVLAGTPPVRAAIYLFVTIAMIFASSGLTCLVGTALIRTRAFSSADQLILRPGQAPVR